MTADLTDGRLFAVCEELFARYPAQHQSLIGQIGGVEGSVYRMTTGTGEEAYEVGLNQEGLDYIRATPYETVGHGGPGRPRLAVPEDMLRALAEMVPDPPMRVAYRYTDAPSGAGYLVMATKTGLQVRSLSNHGAPVPAELQDLNAPAFWGLYQANRLSETQEGLLGAGLIWRPSRHRGVFDLAEDISPGDITLRVPREPMAMPQVDRAACAANRMTQLRWVHELSDDQTTGEVDEAVGRRPYERVTGQRQTGRLLRDGFEVVSLCDYDAERFKAEGFGYLREYYRRIWTAEWARYFEESHQYFKALNEAEAQSSQQLVDDFGDKYREEQVQPTLDHAYQFLADGYMLALSVQTNRVGTTHAVLVMGLHKGEFVVYNPDSHKPVFQLWTPEYLVERWMPEDGLEAVRRLS